MSQPRIVVTAGEPAGIGPDVVLRALQSEFAARIAVIADLNVMRERADLLGITCHIDGLENPEDVAPHTPGRLQVLHIPCAQTVVPGTLNTANAPFVVSTLGMAAELTGSGLYDAVVTAPVQKSIINDSGIPFSGHTEFFADFFGGRNSAIGQRISQESFTVSNSLDHLDDRLVIAPAQIQAISLLIGDDAQFV